MFILRMKEQVFMYVANAIGLVILLFIITSESMSRMSTLPPEFLDKQKQLTAQNESYRQFPYTDTTGHLTIGIGRNLSECGISYLEAFSLFQNDVDYFYSRLNSLVTCFDRLDIARQVVLVDICFNVGINGLLEFKQLLLALECNDFDRAAQEIINSKAYTQAPNRYQKNADIMRTGVI
jgi:lysozyme